MVMSIQGQQKIKDSVAFGKSILQNALKQIDDSDGEMVYADYWNLALANAYMGKDKKVVLNYLRQSKDASVPDFYIICKKTIVAYGGLENVHFYKILRDEFISLMNEAKHKMANMEVAKPEKIDNIKNEEVVDILKAMMVKDRQYRTRADFFTNDSIRKLQYKLDAENTKELEYLFNKFGYPGKSIVGDNEYQDYTCLIVEHGQTLENQKKWFEIIAKALKNEELNKNPVRMLIDRIHWRETGKQIFGSHAEIPFDNEEVIKDIEEKYGL
jgi:uncharacterized protein YfkK (UPF0435 family)